MYIKATFSQFVQHINETNPVNIQSLYDEEDCRNIGYTSVLTQTAKSYAELIKNYVAYNCKQRNHRYFLRCMSNPNDICYVDDRVSVSRYLANFVFMFANSDSLEMPEVSQRLDLAPLWRQKATEFMNECLPNMGPAPLWPDRLRDNCEKYIPWMFNCSEAVETSVSIDEPISQDKVSKIYIHRRIEEIITTTELHKNFKQALKDNVRRIINQGKDISYGEKKLLDDFIHEHIDLIQNAQFKPEKFTGPRDIRGVPTIEESNIMPSMDINTKSDIRNITIWEIDPGMNDIYVASGGDCDELHRTRKKQEKKNITISVNTIPQPNDEIHMQKNSSLLFAMYCKTSVRHVLQNYTTITNYPDHTALRKSNIKYGSLVENERVLRPNKRTSLVLIDYVAENDKPIIIVYGTAEFQTSRPGTIFGPNKLIRTRLEELRTFCNTRWNRIHMASMNIRNIFGDMAEHSNSRLSVFTRRADGQ
ncbi:MAG: hypothetical protein EXX96DRAFT_652991 [Benjaminiella poitrasii]|nr:MAG: hypothetical protein EXX96DRAFT_652991 [Benjaminiella poitrasii]